MRADRGMVFPGRFAIVAAVSLVIGLSGPAATLKLLAQTGTQLLDKARALEATVQALAANGSPKALATLQELVSGKPDFSLLSELAARTALTELVRRAKADDCQFFVTALVHPEGIRPAGQGSYAARQLQADTARAIADHASAELRTAIAGSLTEPANAEQTRSVFGQIFSTPHPANLPALVSICFREAAGADLKSNLPGVIHSSNRLLLDLVLNVPQALASSSVAASPRQVSDHAPTVLQEDHRRFVSIASEVWNEPFVAGVVRGLNDPSYDRRTLLALLASLPHSSARRQLRELLQAEWLQGPEAFGGEQLPQTWLDPGAIVILKSVPHASLPAAEPGTPPNPRRNIRSETQTLKRRTTMAAWSNTILQCVRAQCARFAGAAAIAGPVHSGANPTAPPILDSLRLNARQNIRIVDQYHAELPWTIVGAPAGMVLDPLLVDYVRIEQRGEVAEICTSYQKALNAPRLHHFEQQTWLDVVAEDSSSNSLRSIDVLVTAPTGETEDGQAGAVGVEILAVGIPRVANRAASSPTADSDGNEERLRTWTDSTGQHHFQGELIDFREGNVHLKGRDGKAITVPIDKLSPADQEFVRSPQPN